MTQTATQHPALAIRDAVNTVTTELVRADIAPKSLFLVEHDDGTRTVNLQLRSRAAFDAARHLFDARHTSMYEGPEGRPMISGRGMALDVLVRVFAPATDETIPADCESAAGTV